VSDVFKRQNCVLFSDGALTWDSPNLIVPAGVKITFQIHITDVSAASRYVLCEYISFVQTTWNMNNNLYLELSRANLQSGAAVSINGSVGQRFITSATLPEVQDNNDGNPQQTLSVPIALTFTGFNLDISGLTEPYLKSESIQR
jgi:hypothetical protein